MIEILSFIPKPIQLGVLGLIVGGAGFLGMESRYVNSSQFTKSYILNLKQAIRKELHAEDLTEREKERLEDDLAELIDELCYETNNNDRLCEDAD